MLTAEAEAGPPSEARDVRLVHVQHHELGDYWLACEGAPDLLCTENESNAERLWGIQSRAPFVKDGIHETVVNGAEGKVNPQGVGTKVSAHYHLVGAIAFRSTSTSTVIAGAASVPAIRPGGRLW